MSEYETIELDRLIVLPGEPYYSKYLQKVMNKHKVRSTTPIMAFAVGEYVVVISGKGLRSETHVEVKVNRELKSLIDKACRLVEEANEIIARIYEDIYGEEID